MKYLRQSGTCTRRRSTAVPNSPRRWRKRSEYLHSRQRKEKRERGSAENSSPERKKQTLKKAEEEWQVILDNFKISLKVM